MDNIQDEFKQFNIIDIKKLLPKMKSLIPNVLLIFSIGMVIILLLLSVKYTNLQTVSVMTSFYFTLHPCNSYESFLLKKTKDKSCAGVTQKDSIIDLNEKETIQAVMADFKEDYCEKRNIEDLEGMQPMLYVCRAAYLVSSNMSNIVIKGLYSILNFKGGIGVLMLYVGMFLLLKFLRDFIQQFIPTFAKSKKKSSFILDIIFSILSITAVVYVLCLIPTILTYLTYLLYGFVYSDGAGSTNVLRTMYFICIVIIPIAMWLVGAGLNIQEGMSNKKKKKSSSSKGSSSSSKGSSSSSKGAASSSTTGSSSKEGLNNKDKKNKDSSSVKCGDYNWIFFIAFVLIIPFMAAMKQIPFLIISGLHGFTCIGQDPNKAEILKKIGFVSAYGIIIFIGLIFFPLIIHMLRNVTEQIKFKFLTEFLDKLEDLTQIVK
jgi:hypothetical protein